MQHSKNNQGSTAAKRIALFLVPAIAAAVLGTAALAAASHATAATAPATATTTATASHATASHATASHAAARTATRPESALARTLRRFFARQAATGMTRWIKSGAEQRNEAILVQARADAFPHRDAALPADSAALAASARRGLAHPSPQDTAGWDTLMHDELTIAAELPVPAEGNAATAEAPVIEQAYLAFTNATS
jgi:hypothetical protein